MATTAAPRYEQQMSALGVANIVRCTNARTCSDLKALPHAKGCRVVAELLRHDSMEGPLGSLPVWRLLKAIRHMGDVKAERIMGVASVREPRRTLRRLTVRQRHLIAHALEQRT